MSVRARAKTAAVPRHGLESAFCAGYAERAYAPLIGWGAFGWRSVGARYPRWRCSGPSPETSSHNLPVSLSKALHRSFRQSCPFVVRADVPLALPRPCPSAPLAPPFPRFALPAPLRRRPHPPAHRPRKREALTRPLAADVDLGDGPVPPVADRGKDDPAVQDHPPRRRPLRAVRKRAGGYQPSTPGTPASCPRQALRPDGPLPPPKVARGRRRRRASASRATPTHLVSLKASSLDGLLVDDIAHGGGDGAGGHLRRERVPLQEADCLGAGRGEGGRPTRTPTISSSPSTSSSAASATHHSRGR